MIQATGVCADMKAIQVASAAPFPAVMTLKMCRRCDSILGLKNVVGTKHLVHVLEMSRQSEDDSQRAIAMVEPGMSLCAIFRRTNCQHNTIVCLNER